MTPNEAYTAKQCVDCDEPATKKRFVAVTEPDIVVTEWVCDPHYDVSLSRRQETQ